MTEDPTPDAPAPEPAERFPTPTRPPRRPGPLERSFMEFRLAARPYGYPVFAAFVVAMLTFGLWRAIDDDHDHNLWSVTGAEVERLKSDVIGELRTRAEIMRGLALQLERLPGGPTHEAFDAMATVVLRQENQFRAIVWVDPSLEVRWVAPPTERLEGFTMDPRDDVVRVNELALQDSSSGGFVSHMVPLTGGKQQTLIGAPIVHDGRLAGYLVGAARTHDLIDAIVHPAFVRGYTVSVYEGTFQLFGPSWENVGSEAEWARDTEMQVGAMKLRIQMWPGPELIHSFESVGAKWALAVGTLLSLLAGWAAWTIQELRRRLRAVGPIAQAPTAGESR